jgi:hypothetical protein
VREALDSDHPLSGFPVAHRFRPWRARQPDRRDVESVGEVDEIDVASGREAADPQEPRRRRDGYLMVRSQKQFLLSPEGHAANPVTLLANSGLSLTRPSARIVKSAGCSASDFRNPRTARFAFGRSGSIMSNTKAGDPSHTPKLCFRKTRNLSMSFCAPSGSYTYSI